MKRNEVALSVTPDHPNRPMNPNWQLVRRPEFVTLVLILILSVLIGSINPVFLSPSSLFDVLRSATKMGILALGVLLVLAAGGIDVSFTAIGIFSMYATTTLAVNFWMDAPFPILLGSSLLIGTLLGVFNGFLVYRFKVPSLIVTIGTQYLFVGFLKAFIGTKHIMNIPPAMDAVGTASLFQGVTADGARFALPALTLMLVLVAGVTWYILNRTLLGRAVYAVGGSITIAERLGFSVRTVMLFVFGYTGLLAGLAGMVHGSLNRLANPSDLVGSELDVIAAVVLGGARVTGGTGTVTGTLLGVVLVIIINTSLILIGVPSTWQKLVIGSIILIASGVFSRRSASLAARA
jgi:simple sugar transport system permease protein